MTQKQQNALLKAAGFELVKQNRHYIWQKGEVRCTVHCGSKTDFRAEYRVRAAIRRAEREQRS